MAKNKLIRMSEDEFYEKYNPVKNHLDANAAFDGCMFETYGTEVDYVSAFAKNEDRKKVWTIIEAEGNFYYLSGYHIVNRFGYLITEEAFPEDQDIEVELDNEIDDSRLHTAIFVKEITVIDPDTKGEVEIAIYKHEGGGMFGVDSSFLDQVVNTDDFDRPIIPDLFSYNGVEEGTISHVVLMDVSRPDTLDSFIENADLPQD